jgi:hypothetical protein
MRRAALFTSSALMGAALVLAGGGIAQADPYDCATSRTGDAGFAMCSNGTGTYRAISTCEHDDGHRYVATPGPYVRVGKLSASYCRVSYDDVVSVTIQVGPN